MLKVIFYTSISIFLLLVLGCPISESKPNQYSVIYHLNGASSGEVQIDKNIYNEGQTVTVLGYISKPIKEGFLFSGWNTSNDGTGHDYSIGDTLKIEKSDINLYSKWLEDNSTVIPVSSITLNSYDEILSINEENTLVATILPSDASDKTILWSSLDPAIVTVDDSGTIKGVSAGSTKINATSADGNIIASCKVTVPLIEMIFVQNGTFEMGFNHGQTQEKPAHDVTLTNNYYIGKYEVTQKQWETIMGNNPSSVTGDNLPVESVSWNDAVLFCNKLSEFEGKSKVYTITDTKIIKNEDANGYRLPTEAQWEFAAIGGNKSRGYEYSGSNTLSDVTWYFGYGVGAKLHDVGGKLPNELGIYDMSGNVWEWCWDWFGDYSNTEQVDPEGNSSGTYRVIRGGSWINNDSILHRVKYRAPGEPNKISEVFGFRIALPAQ